LVKGQTLDDASANTSEQEVLSIVVGHIKHFWHATLGESPSDHEVQELLLPLRIHVLDVDARGADEQEAKDRLRTAILRDPAHTDFAWASLIEFCGQLAAERSGADRPRLQQVLLNAGIELQASRSYREDIDRLRAHTRTTAGLLAQLARIRVGATQIKIARPSTDALRRASEDTSVLVVGEPGAGKSGALHDLTARLIEEGRDVVFLAVDHFAAHSLWELRRDLQLEREVLDVLANWPGTAPAFLVIDALDAARTDPAAKTFRTLIQSVAEQQDRWRVVASIRKFDLRYSLELQQLFWGEPPSAFRDPDFLTIQHLNIPRLSDEELAQIPSQSPALQALLDGAPAGLRELLRVPFNLRLMAELLGIGIDPADLTPIRTQLELLDRYWLHRVVRNDGQWDAREGVLRQVCDAMVRTRALRVDRAHIAAPETSLVLNDLQSTELLTAWKPSLGGPPDQYVLTFAHHVLFDYAVARLLLRGTPETLLARLTSDPELVIFARPSLLLHFQHLWAVDPSRQPFWQLVFVVIQVNRIPEIGKLIGPAVAADLARALTDLDPLCIAIDSADQQTRAVADQVLRHLIGSLVAATPAEQSLTGANAGPWCDLLDRVSQRLREPLPYTIRPLLVTLCEHPAQFTPEQRAAAGEAARRLLEFVWMMTTRDPWLVAHALQAVCRTFESDPSSSAGLLRQCLQPAHLTQYAYEEMPRLAQEVGRLIPLDSTLVHDIYRTAFAYQEPSTEPTRMSLSQILPMTSNRRQDFEFTLYELTEVFPEFLAQTPRQATSTLIAVIEAYVAQEHRYSSDEIEESFLFNGRGARIRSDHSISWDTNDLHHDDQPLKMLNAFEQYLEHLAEQEDGAREFNELIEIVARENRLAIVWRRLLRLGARFPRTLGRTLLPLAWAVPVLKGLDTSTPAGEFLNAIFPEISSDMRERIERTLLAIPETFPTDRQEAGEKIRNRLLGCLTPADLTTDEARRLLTDLQAANAVPDNEPPFRYTRLTGKSFGEEEFLAEQGVPVAAEANQKIRILEQPVKAFTDQHRNTTLTPEEVAAVLPAVRTLWMALARADTDGVHPQQRDYAWNSLAAACEGIARLDGLSCEDEAGALTRAVLLEASRHPHPPYDSESDAHFHDHLAWGSPAARIEAAQGLILLARHTTCATTEVLEAIERLSAHRTEPVPAVRFQTAHQLNLLYRTAPTFMWQLIERLCREEPSRGVLQGLLSGTLGRLSGAHPDQVTTLTQEIFARVQDGPGAHKVRELCTDIFTLLYIWRDHATCRDIVLGIVADPMANADDASSVLRHLREPLTHGPVQPPDPEQDAIRQRAFDLLSRLLHTAYDQRSLLENTYKNVAFSAWSETDQQRARSLTRLIDDIGDQLYFASGAFERRKEQGTVAPEPLTPEQERFYQDAGPVLDTLAKVGLASLSHHLLELLEMFIPSDPAGVFRRIGHVIRGGQKGGYQYESLAVDLMVRLVEQYLAERRPLLREDDECRQILLEILDIFVQAGWPKARRLAYRLEEIFR